MFTIVGKRYTIEEFAACVAMLEFEPGGFKPDMVVLHNTAVPSLAQRPEGFTERHMQNLRGYYAGLGWKGGPHLFVDDYGIWVFNPLDKRGTHSPAWNGLAWGVEMLGDYDKEPFDSGRGAEVRTNAVAAVSELLRKIGTTATSESFKLHKEDPKTDHDCPGKNVHKDEFAQRVNVRLSSAFAAAAPKPVKVVFYRKGHGHEPAGVLEAWIRDDGKAYVSAKAMSITTGIWNDTGADGPVRVSDFLHGRYALTYDAAERKVYAVEN